MSIRTTALRIGAGIAATGFVLAGSVGVHAAATPAPSPAAAQTAGATTVPPAQGGLTLLKARCENAISQRQTVLGNDGSRVSGSDALTAADRSALTTMITNDKNGLAALGQKIAADTTVSQTRADCHTIVTGYRVYVVLDPQVHLTIAADRTTKVDGELTTLSGELQAAINNSNAPASAKQAAETSLADLTAKVNASKADVAPISAEVLAVTPADYPNNVSALTAARNSLKASYASLQGARGDVNAIIKDLGQ